MNNELKKILNDARDALESGEDSLAVLTKAICDANAVGYDTGYHDGYEACFEKNS